MRAIGINISNSKQWGSIHRQCILLSSYWILINTPCFLLCILLGLFSYFLFQVNFYSMHRYIQKSDIESLTAGSNLANKLQLQHFMVFFLCHALRFLQISSSRQPEPAENETDMMQWIKTWSLSRRLPLLSQLLCAFLAFSQVQSNWFTRHC